MKTPDEIKRGLECCGTGNRCKAHCPYDGRSSGIYACTSTLSRDALAYIQHLERENAQKDERIKQYEQDTNGFWYLPGYGKLPVRLNCSFRWISVEERLPEQNRVVLVALRLGGKKTVRIGTMAQICGWWDECGLVSNATVTHWMPLPEPPEEGEER